MMRFGTATTKGSFLLVLAKRWQDLLDQTRKDIESRFLEGPARWDGEDDAEWKTRKAWASVNRLHWLADNGCEFTFDLAAESMKLRRVSLLNGAQNMLRRPRTPWKVGVVGLKLKQNIRLY